MNFLFNLPLQKKGTICLCSLGKISLLLRISLKSCQFHQKNKKSECWLLFRINKKNLNLSFRNLAKSELMKFSFGQAKDQYLNPNKEQRLLKIIKEATEQSWSSVFPKLTFLSDIKPLHKNWQFVVFDLPNHKQKLQNKKSDLPLLWVVGPEGGLTEKDYSQFPEEFQIDFLGEQVLRMETAAIIGGWKLKQYI